MEEIKDQLVRLRAEQAKLLKEFDEAVKEYEATDLIQENKQLRKSDHEFRQKLRETSEKLEQTEQENRKLRTALQEQMLDEKRNILKISKQKIHTYFGNEINPEKNRLLDLEVKTKREIIRLKERSARSIQQEKQTIAAKLDDVAREINEIIQKEQALLIQQEKKARSGMTGQYQTLEEEHVTEEIIQKRVKQNQIEMKIGLNWINKLGILLIILGVAAAFRHSYTNWFNDYVKGGMFFVLGLLMLGAGEWLHSKNRKTFALGVIGGGISVLYGSIFFSYFLLNLLNLTSALLLSIGVTAAAVYLALRYHSKTIISFGLVGGYIPFYSYLFAFGLEGNAVYAAMAYILILNLSILWISFQRQWSIVHYISFGLNIPSLLVLLILSPSTGISMLYSILIFLLYLGLTIAYPFKHKTSLRWMDISLLVSNTFVSCMIMYFLFNVLGWDDFRGLLAVAFCALYYGLGKFVEKIIPKERLPKILFYGTSITFAVLVIPFQFGAQWLSIGWLVEGVVLILYANRHKVTLLERAGWGIFGLTLLTFSLEVLQNLTYLWPVSEYFHLNYFLIIAGLVLVTGYYLVDQSKKDRTYLFKGFDRFIKGFKYFTVLNVWIYVLYESIYRYTEWVADDFDEYWFYLLLMTALLSMGLAGVLEKIPLVVDRVIRIFSLILYGIGSFIGIVITFTIPTLEPAFADNEFSNWLALMILIGFNGIIYWIGRDLLLSAIRSRFKNAERYPAILSIYLLAMIAAFLTVQFQVGDVGFVFSSVYLVVAIGYILYGFKNNYVVIRRIGLAVTLAATAKLFLFDLLFLAETSKILAYFCFGLALLGISYIYQKVSSLHKEPAKVESQEDH
ncbi:DUF2339 domain-containing protein [Jeotgalibacillus campisalis]|uniref:DUF2339 domain-containing protein n=1 Tax=Jeotgalibacillus campisalis TaxID=220754 RepID=A0A0C2WAH6_9BACL|nr:DUF2339 domain-containing protein [Jeotgalibacillus campisalis]KIL53033.1 hypothetical protein KR50_03620 [Jeotgalibacillus campisalis]